MQTKCYASVDFSFSVQMLFICEMFIWFTCLLSEVQFSWCRCPMRWCKCNIHPWWCQRTYLPVIQLSPYRVGDAKCLVVQMLSNGHVMMQNASCRDVMMQMTPWCMPWCECPLVGMSWCKCPLGSMPWCECPIAACHDANVSLRVCHDANVRLGSMSWRECPLISVQ